MQRRRTAPICGPTTTERTVLSRHPTVALLKNSTHVLKCSRTSLAARAVRIRALAVPRIIKAFQSHDVNLRILLHVAGWHSVSLGNPDALLPPFRNGSSRASGLSIGYHSPGKKRKRTLSLRFVFAMVRCRGDVIHKQLSLFPAVID